MCIFISALYCVLYSVYLVYYYDLFVTKLRIYR
jgi:hypothetical protein